MLTIRLRRAGAKRDPHYRVVVTESSARRDGPFIEIVGHYHPRRQPAEIVLDMERVEAYLGQGAQMSDTVRSLFRRVRSGRVEVPAETAPATDASDEAQLEAAAELEADSEAEAQADPETAPEQDATEVVEEVADDDAASGEAGDDGEQAVEAAEGASAETEEDSPAEEAEAETDESGKQD